MANPHIMKNFDTELKELDKMVAEMGGIAETQIKAATETLASRDREQALRVIEHDKVLDQLQMDVDMAGVNTITRRQPIANDLRQVIATLNIASSLERIGDYAKGIAKRSISLAQMPVITPLQSTIRMSTEVQKQLHQALNAWLKRDQKLSDAVILADRNIDALHTNLYHELTTCMMQDTHHVAPCTHVLFIAKNLERTGDHATNIAESVFFYSEGHAPEEPRINEDEAYYMVEDNGETFPISPETGEAKDD